ncbi:hypothetical protein GCM10010219_56170 [Streptomyces netropsis]|nr:hypothetical protein GCM10010219_56170 [Streptomyces netropsis]
MIRRARRTSAVRDPGFAGLAAAAFTDLLEVGPEPDPLAEPVGPEAERGAGAAADPSTSPIFAGASPPGGLGSLAAFVFFADGRSPTAELRAGITLPVPLSCALTGVLDTRPD